MAAVLMALPEFSYAQKPAAAANPAGMTTATEVKKTELMQEAPEMTETPEKSKAPGNGGKENEATKEKNNYSEIARKALKLAEKTTAEFSSDEPTIQKRNEVAYDIVKNALSHVGTAYVWGGESKDGYDCSGFVRAVFHESGLSVIRGYGVIPRATGFHGDDGNSWKGLVDNMQVGDRITFAGKQRSINYTLAYKDCTYENDLPLPEGSIIVNRGHIRIIIKQMDSFEVSGIRDYIYNRYGVETYGKTQEDKDIIHVMNEENHNFDVEAYGNETGEADEGVIVCNSDMGIEGGDRYLVAALVPEADNRQLRVRVEGEETGTKILNGTVSVYRDLECTDEVDEKEVEDTTVSFMLDQGTYYVKHTSESVGYLNDDSIYEVKLLEDRELVIEKKEESIGLSIPKMEDVEFKLAEYSKATDDYRVVSKVSYRGEESFIVNYMVRETGRVLKNRNALYYTEDNKGRFRIIGYRDGKEVFSEDLLAYAVLEEEGDEEVTEEENSLQYIRIDTAFLKEEKPHWYDARTDGSVTKKELVKLKMRSAEAIRKAEQKLKEEKALANPEILLPADESEKRHIFRKKFIQE